ncbi:MAG: maleate cis-trans isomerase family protein [Aestuariivirgaceae bacterium]
MLNPSRGRARIGVLVPFTNTNLEADLAMLRTDGVSFHFARLGGYDADEIPDDKQMAGLGAVSLDEPLRLIAGARPDVILYGCTSATLTHGIGFDRELAERIRSDTGAATVTAAGALVHALQALGAKRIGFASPYVGAINDQAIAFLAAAGIETVARADIGKALGNYGQGELTPDEVFALGERADHPDAQAIVLSCTDMRSIETIERLEAALGKPVVSSNQAMLFAALEVLGIGAGKTRLGELFKLS